MTFEQALGIVISACSTPLPYVEEDPLDAKLANDGMEQLQDISQSVGVPPEYVLALLLVALTKLKASKAVVSPSAAACVAASRSSHTN